MKKYLILLLKKNIFYINYINLEMKRTNEKKI